MAALMRRLLSRKGSPEKGPAGAPEVAVGTFGRLSGDLRREVAGFDREVVRIGWCEYPSALAPDRAAWQLMLEQLKVRRRRTLAAALSDPAASAALPPASLEFMLLRGWHLAFHCYGVAAGLLYPEDGEGEGLKRRDLQEAYHQARHRLTEALGGST